MGSINIARNQATAAEIKRLEDGDLNPLNNRKWPEGHKDILQVRRSLPVYARCQEILDIYHNNNVFVLTSKTGSGKSTQLPQFFVFDEWMSGKLIACTQPRRLAATAVASRVATEMGVNLGEEVGYQIGGDSKVIQGDAEGNGKTRLAYVTEGTLLAQLNSDPLLSRYCCVIIDEAHERTVEADMLMGILKKVLKKRLDFKLVIMSATVDASLFQGYFDDCPLVHLDGQNFNVEVKYWKRERLTSSFTVMAAETALMIHQGTIPGNILIFLPGEAEIKVVRELISLYTKGQLKTVPLFARLPGEQQDMALDSAGDGRKCIVSTNIAETSLTIPGVVFVIDCGLSRQMIYNARLDMDMLELRPISQASANQRKGRAGRTRDGICYRLYSKEDFEMLPLSSAPAVRCRPIDAGALKLISMGYKKPVDFDWIDVPHPENMARAALCLREQGFVDDKGPTKDGKLAAVFGMEPVWTHAILIGDKFGCVHDMIDIAVVCSARKSIWLRPEGLLHLSEHAMGEYKHDPSDHLAMANAFNAYLKMRELAINQPDSGVDLEEWCGAHFLDIEALEDARISRRKLGKTLQSRFTASRAEHTDKRLVRKALASAFCHHAAIADKDNGYYRTMSHGVEGLIEPLSAALRQQRLDPKSEMAEILPQHEWIVYTKLGMSGGQVLMKIVTAVEAEWLAELPAFQDDQLPKKTNGEFRQPRVKKSLDAARARAATSALSEMSL